MKPHRLISLLLLILPVSVGASEPTSDKTDNPTGFIDILVQSNINRLVFNYDLYKNCIKSTHGTKTNYKNDSSEFRIMIPVRDFRCRNKSVYKDFLTLLKADQFPFLEIKIPQNTEIYLSENNSGILHNVTISLNL